MPALIRASSNSLRGPKQSGGRHKQQKKKPASLKNQIRAVERLLRKEGLDARVRKKEQARLQQLKEAAESHKAQELERKYAVRYHKIRFFERVKLERRIKQLEREVEGVDLSADEHVHAKLAQAKGDLQYVVNYPKGEKYVSLLRNAEDPEAQKVLEAERKRIRAKVRQHLADIAMITQPNEGIPQLRKQPTQPQASPSPDQDMPNPDEAKPRAQALTKAALRTPASKQKALSADQHEQPPLKGSSVLSALAGQTIAASAAPPSEPGRQSAGAPVASSRQQGGGLAGGDAEPDDIEEDDFFMSSSADEAVQVKQPAHLSQPSDLPAILPQERISSEQQHLASASMMHHHSKHRKGIQHSRKLPPGQRRADQGLKIHAKLAVPSVPKAMKQVHKKRSTARQAAPGKLTVTARGQPCRGQPDGRAPSATADKPSPGAAPDKRQGQPLRTRADGGRKRRKKP